MIMIAPLEARTGGCCSIRLGKSDTATACQAVSHLATCVDPCGEWRWKQGVIVGARGVLPRVSLYRFRYADNQKGVSPEVEVRTVQDTACPGIARTVYRLLILQPKKRVPIRHAASLS